MPKVTPTLRRRRQQAGLKVSDLADLVGAKTQHLKNVESGHGGMSVELAHKVAEVLDMTVDEIFGADTEDAA